MCEAPILVASTVFEASNKVVLSSGFSLKVSLMKKIHSASGTDKRRQTALTESSYSPAVLPSCAPPKVVKLSMLLLYT